MIVDKSKFDRKAIGNFLQTWGISMIDEDYIINDIMQFIFENNGRCACDSLTDGQDICFGENDKYEIHVYFYDERIELVPCAYLVEMPDEAKVIYTK